MAGRFVVVEGGDGAGKSTLLAALAARLAASGAAPVMTREPGGTEEGLALRQLLLEQNGATWEADAELLLMTAARVQHVRRVILPALQAGHMVLCDRFVGSTLAYQGGGRGIDPQRILDLHQMFVGDLWPDLTLLLDLEPARGLARSRARLTTQGSEEGRFEALDLAFHHRVREAFRTLAASRPGWVVLDAAAPRAELADRAVRALGPQG